MDLQLSEKMAFVTGSTAGIGYAIAERVDNAIASIRTTAPAALVFGFAAYLGAADAAREAIRRFPQVDILVNNLGIFAAVPFEKIPDEDWIRFFEVNVLSGVRLSRGYLPGM